MLNKTESHRSCSAMHSELPAFRNPHRPAGDAHHGQREHPGSAVFPPDAPREKGPCGRPFRFHGHRRTLGPGGTRARRGIHQCGNPPQRKAHRRAPKAQRLPQKEQARCFYAEAGRGGGMDGLMQSSRSSTLRLPASTTLQCLCNFCNSGCFASHHSFTSLITALPCALSARRR